MLVVARRFPGQARAPFRSTERVAAVRDARVRELVRYAAETVPYYRELGIDPDEFRSADDLGRLPLLERSVLQAAPGRFVSESPRARGAFRIETSGTSGAPVAIFHDRVSILENIAFGERERAVEVAFTGKRFRYTIAQFMSERSSVSLVRSWYARSSFRPLRPTRHYLSLFAPYQALADELERLRPDVVIGYGGHLEMLFRDILDRGRKLDGLAAIVYGRDRMTDEGRRLIEAGLGTPVIARYASIESFKIAFACELRAGLHLHEDLCHVRLVRRDGTPVQPGEPGEVVLSNLVNHGSVILNYRLGDLARLEEAPCPCGRSGRRLVDLDGRADDIVELVDGTIVHPGSVQGVVTGWEGVVRTQLVQLAPERFELRLVAREGAFARHREALAAEMSALLGGARVEVVEYETLDPPDGAKFRQIEALRRRP
jgi:phenylacetate-CoA ligase